MHKYFHYSWLNEVDNSSSKKVNLNHVGLCIGPDSVPLLSYRAVLKVTVIKVTVVNSRNRILEDLTAVTCDQKQS